MKTMKGVNVPISCPMTPDQQVDYKSLESLCEYLTAVFRCSPW